MNELYCPICNRHLRRSCEHPLLERLIDGKPHPNGIAYYIWYTTDNKTMVIKEAPYKRIEGWRRKNELILELKGFHILTMDRVERLLLLK